MNSPNRINFLGMMFAWASPLACLAMALNELWLRHPAYHFVPLPLLVLAWLTKKDSRGLLAEGGRLWLTKVLVLTHFGLAATGFVLLSPFFAGLAFWVAMIAYAIGYVRTVREDPPRWAFPSLAVFVIPPPLMLDSDLHQALAGLAAHLSQGWLDAMQLVHVVEGSIVVTSGRRFFVDDACSGTNSLLTVSCLALVVAALRRRSGWHALALLVAGALMSIVSNVLRICVVISGAHFHGLALEEGALHEGLGLAFFVLDLLLVCSADMGLKFLLNRASHCRAATALTRRPSSAVASLWPAPVSFAVAVIGTALVFGPTMLVRSASAAYGSRLDASVQNIDFPSKLAGWSRRGEQAAENTLVGRLGVRNKVWIYQRGNEEAYVAVNYPFKGFHDTRLCYSGQGWQIHQQTDLNPIGENGNMVRFLEMSQPAELVQADLWLAVFDERGVPQRFPSENFAERFSDRLAGRWSQPQTMETTVVLQVLALEPDNAPEPQAMRAQLLAAARLWLSSTLAGSSTSISNLPN